MIPKLHHDDHMTPDPIKSPLTMAFSRGLILLWLVPFVVHGYAILPRQQRQRCNERCPSRLRESIRGGDDANDGMMEALITQLSATPDDTDRREQLASTLREGMMEDASFAPRFEATLMQRGEKIQTQARQDTDNEAGKKELWALVDMMVQSKVIIKKFNQKEEAEKKD